MSLTYVHDPITNELLEVGKDGPLPVEIKQDSYLPPVAGQTITRLVKVPGCAAAAYHAGDAIGTLITFRDVFRPEKMSGVIVSAFLLDLSDQAIQVDVPIYVAPITASADNAAATPSDADLLLCRGAFSINSFVNLGANSIGTATGINLWVNGRDTNLYTQISTPGAPTIAANSDPWIGICVVPD